jgi:hypothetical protein
MSHSSGFQYDFGGSDGAFTDPWMQDSYSDGPSFHDSHR